MSVDNMLDEHLALRLATIVGSNNNKVFCNCEDSSGPGSQGALSCCNVVELGTIYEQEPDLSGVCSECTRERQDGSIASSTSPHGKITDWRRACARLIVFTKVDLSGGTFSYEDRFMYYSRQIGQLPGPSVCENLPIICPAESGIYQCCPTVINNGVVSKKVAGVCQKCYETVDASCSGEAKVLHEYSLSPCQLGSGGFMAGYAYAPDDWWFLDSGEYGQLTIDILENNPYYGLAKPFYHTVYLYLQLESKYIYCCNWECDSCNTPSSNLRAGPCGQSNYLGILDTELRERSVRIFAAIGYAANSCGYTPESACSLAASVGP